MDLDLYVKRQYLYVRLDAAVYFKWLRVFPMLDVCLTCLQAIWDPIDPVFPDDIRFVCPILEYLGESSFAWFHCIFFHFTLGSLHNHSQTGLLFTDFVTVDQIESVLSLMRLGWTNYRDSFAQLVDLESPYRNLIFMMDFFSHSYVLS